MCLLTGSNSLYTLKNRWIIIVIKPKGLFLMEVVIMNFSIKRIVSLLLVLQCLLISNIAVSSAPIIPSAPAQGMQAATSSSSWNLKKIGSLVTLGVGAAAYLGNALYRYSILRSMPALITNPAEITEAQKFYEWRSEIGNICWKTPASLLRAENNSKIVSKSLEQDLNIPGVMDIKKKNTREPYDLQDALNAIGEEYKALSSHMEKLKPYTDVPAFYKKICIDAQIEGTPGLMTLTAEQEKEIYEKMVNHIQGLDDTSPYKLKTWWNKLRSPFYVRTNQTYWDLFKARSRLDVLRIIISNKIKSDEETQSNVNAQPGAARRPIQPGPQVIQPGVGLGMPSMQQRNAGGREQKMAAESRQPQQRSATPPAGSASRNQLLTGVSFRLA